MTHTQQSCIYHGNVQVDGCWQRRAESGFMMQLDESSLTKFSACGGTYTHTYNLLNKANNAWSLVKKYLPCLTNIRLLDLQINTSFYIYNQPNKNKTRSKKKEKKMQRG